MWSTACPDWRQRLLAGDSLVPDLALFEAEAIKALRIFRRLRIPDLIGTPRMAEACGPWVFPIVAALFGCYDPETHRRMIQEYFLLIPKGNAKSSTAGPIMLTAAIMNRRPEAEFDVIAPTLRVANIAFGQAAGTIRADPELDKLFHIREHARAIEHRVNGTKLQIKAADTDVITGGKAVGTLIDETHVFASKPKAADIFVEIRGALGKRPDGFLFQITTQSKEPPSGQFKIELERARAVRDGTLDLPLLPILYELPEDIVESGAWKERRYWGVVNPNLGRSLDEAFLARTLSEAERTGPENLALVASQHFNVEIGLRLRSDRWAGADYWEAAAEPGLTLEALMVRCEVCVVGIDGGGLDDLLGVAVFGRERDTARWLMWHRAWADPIVFERRKSEAQRLQDFVTAGDLVICTHPTQDIEDVADICQQLNDAGLLPANDAVGLDAAGVAAMVDEIASRGLTEDQLASVPQGYRLNGAIKGLERRLKGQTAAHAGSALMDWCVGNAKAELKGNAVLITKQAAGTAKIDPLCASFNATELMGKNPLPARKRTFQMMIVR